MLSVSESFAVAWMRDKNYLYFDAVLQVPELKRIVLLPNNTLVIHNATTDDSSNNYQCIILKANQNIVLTHRLRVDPKGSHSAAGPQQPMTPPPSTMSSGPTIPPQHSHRIYVKTIPKKKIEVNQGQSITFGCETNIQPSPEIKWFIEVR